MCCVFGGELCGSLVVSIFYMSIWLSVCLLWCHVGMCLFVWQCVGVQCLYGSLVGAVV